jgi:tripartite-type tricarboxylate transporter receptor subunit TctC
VPSITEEGLTDSDIVGWYGLMAPAGTDKAIVRKLNEQVRAALASDDVKARIATIGADIAAGTAADFAAFVKSEITRWGDVVVKSGAQPE